MRRAATAVGLDVVGSAAVLVLLSLTWQRVTVVRQPPFSDVVVGLSGRGVAPAAFGFALVTIAGAVAALATRGLARRLVGVVVTLAGLAVAVAAGLALGAPSDADVRTLAAQALADRTSTGTVVPITDGTVAVAVQAAWPVLAAVAAVLTVAAGVLWTLPVPAPTTTGAVGAGGLGPRYEAPVAAERPRDATLWSALDHGEDPTAGPAVDRTADTIADPTTDPTADTADAMPTEVEPDPDTHPRTPRR